MKFFVVFALLFAAVAVYAGPVAQESDPQSAVPDVLGGGSASSSVAQEIDPESAATEVLGDGVGSSSVAQESDTQSAVTADVSRDGSASSSVAQQENLSPADITQIQSILTKIVGPKLSNSVIKLVSTLTNKALKGVPLNAALHAVTQQVTQLLQNGGTVEKLLAGSGSGSGQQSNLTPADLAKLQDILTITVGPYTAGYVVRIVALIINGLLGKVPLNKVLQSVTGLTSQLLQPDGLVGKLVGQQGLVASVGKQLGVK